MNVFMKEALRQAKKAFSEGEVPVGAVVVLDGKIVSKARNSRESSQNALHHAEVLAIDKACKKLKTFRLQGCEMFVTLEPCVMCSGAISAAWMSRVLFGAKDENLAISCKEILGNERLEHKVEVVGGVDEKECKEVLLNFFEKVREKNKVKKMLGKDVCEKTFSFCFEKGKFFEVSRGRVVAVVERVKEMEAILVVSQRKAEISADEIFAKLEKSGEKGRMKIVTMWGEKKLFN